MAIEVVMPQMGESIAEGTITKWLVEVGESVERDQPLFEISTDKVDAEIPSPEDGVLLEIRHGEGETVPVDEVVGMLGKPGETLDAGPVVEATPSPPEEQQVTALPVEEDTTAVEAPAVPVSVPVSAAVPPGPVVDPDDPEAALKERIRTHSSPLVRKMAAAEGVDIAQLTGSGIHGRVTKADMERHLVERSQTPAAEAPAPAPAAPSAPAPAPPSSAPPALRQPSEFFVAPYGHGDNVEIEPMSRIRQITAAHMVYSKATSAHVTTCFDIDMSRVAKIRHRAKDSFYASQGTKLTFMPFIFRAVANALKRNRKLNAAIDGANVVFKKDINLGVAVALDWGLIVPVIRNADQLSLVGLAKASNDLAERARTKKLSPDEVQAGTFTITNPGVFGSLWGTPIINQPQVGILGVGVIEKRPIVDTDAEGNDVISIKTMSYFAITYDHRLVDGADADAFMNDLKHTLSTETWNELDPYM